MNTLNGRTYRDDPTILAWDVLNEPRFTSGSTQEARALAPDVVPVHAKYRLLGEQTKGCIAHSLTCTRKEPLASLQVQSWIDEMTHFVKSVDPHHMVRSQPADCRHLK